jgi:hypothetical protein
VQTKGTEAEALYAHKTSESVSAKKAASLNDLQRGARRQVHTCARHGCARACGLPDWSDAWKRRLSFYPWLHRPPQLPAPRSRIVFGLPHQQTRQSQRRPRPVPTAASRDSYPHGIRSSVTPPAAAPVFRHLARTLRCTQYLSRPCTHRHQIFRPRPVEQNLSRVFLPSSNQVFLTAFTHAHFFG